MGWAGGRPGELQEACYLQEKRRPSLRSPSGWRNKTRDVNGVQVLRMNSQNFAGVFRCRQYRTHTQRVIFQ